MSHSEQNGYKASKLKLNDLLNDIEDRQNDILESSNINLRGLVENVFPGGLDGMQKMLDDMQPLLDQKQKLEQQMNRVIDDSDFINQIQGNITLEEMGKKMGNVFKTIGEDKELMDSFAEFQQSKIDIANKVKDDMNL